MTDLTPPADWPTGPDGMAHPEIDELASYSARDLAVPERERVEAHLAGCEACAADIAALVQASVALTELGPVTMPADAAARLDRTIASLSTTAAGATVLPARTRRGGSGWATGAAAAAVLALVAVVGLAAIKGGQSDDED